MDMFNDLNVDDLQNQLEDVIKNITKFFETAENEKTDNDDNSENTEKPKTSIPKLDELNDHLQGLFDGKIGKLAKELAEDMGNDLAKELGEELKGASSTQDILSKLIAKSR